MLAELLPEVSDAELEQFMQVMLTQYGYDFRGYAPASLKRRLGAVIKKYGIPSLTILNQRLLTQPEYLRYFINEITVSTTELFRDPSAWVALRLQVFPALANLSEIRIWHVGASTGEEVLSMAILLVETGLYDKAQIFATDIDEVSLEKAKMARYPLRMKGLYQQNFYGVFPLGNFEKYAKEEANHLVFDPSLLRNVRFVKHNIVTEEPFGQFDIIFCRNLLIYFTPTLQDRVVTKLVDSLVPGGILMIGTKESLFWCAAAKRLTAVNEVERIYRKRK
ncbi:MAG: protein-glutamate O-methyltransferase CheR [Bacteroidia bacterium]|nr:protein-glutamate O-methyltransferase CheR [Bacteroidia bacterium]MCX7763923.1 protein-glutamate O-methyltransferase CheR [Bacteroidia bacterium]MDW8057204.1 protein-glutamate O-methyltransferase CheR [Bacteroidia bacterium]